MQAKWLQSENYDQSINSGLLFAFNDQK